MLMPSDKDAVLSKGDLLAIFNDAAQVVAHDFQRLYQDGFIFTTHEEPIYISPAFAKALRPAVIDYVLQSKKDFFMRDKAAGGVFYWSKPIRGVDAAEVSVNLTDFDRPDMPHRHYTEGRVPYLWSSMFLFDHEVGHATMYHEYRGHVSECIADSYAYLRHIQRFGHSDDFFDYRRSREAMALIKGDAEHYTVSVADKIDLLRHEVDIAALTPEQTVELARRIGAAYAFGVDYRQSIAADFSECQAYYAAVGDAIDDVQELKHIYAGMQKSDAAYRAGHAVFMWRRERVEELAQQDDGIRAAWNYIQKRDQGGIDLNTARVMDDQGSKQRLYENQKAGQVIPSGFPKK